METNDLINKRPNFPDQWHPEVWGNLISGYIGFEASLKLKFSGYQNHIKHIDFNH
jgi:hypothetical protein